MVQDNCGMILHNGIQTTLEDDVIDRLSTGKKSERRCFKTTLPMKTECWYWHLIKPFQTPVLLLISVLVVAITAG